MTDKSEHNKKRQQRISEKNIERIEKIGKMKTGDSFDDVLTRVLDECEKRRKGKTEEVSG
jgi:hypothetical protein